MTTRSDATQLDYLKHLFSDDVEQGLLVVISDDSLTTDVHGSPVSTVRAAQPVSPGERSLGQNDDLTTAHRNAHLLIKTYLRDRQVVATFKEESAIIHMQYDGKWLFRVVFVLSVRVRRTDKTVLSI